MAEYVMNVCGICGHKADDDRHLSAPHVFEPAEPATCLTCRSRAASFQCLRCLEERCWECFRDHECGEADRG